MIDKATTLKALNAFVKTEPGTCLVLVTSVTGDYYITSEFADNTGPGTNRELVGIKRMDGTVKYFRKLEI